LDILEVEVSDMQFLEAIKIPSVEV